ncbi:MAG: AraC family transcriptional regulator, partial [Gammaproteobacteria bacterium]|nr:AraC family transcriptional regulator [Gammaproteobacteria bacterium]
PSSYDILGDVLETLRFKGTIFIRSQMNAPWGLSLNEVKYPRFHISMSGDFFINPEGGKEPIEIQEAGVVMLPTGKAHWIADRPGRKLLALSEEKLACQFGKPMFHQEPTSNSLMCGLIRFDEQTTHPLLNALPDIIHIPSIKSSSIWSLIELIDKELIEYHSLSSVVVDRLSEVLFLKFLHEFMKQPDQTMGFFSALHDRRLNAAIQLIHQRMNENWTIDKLALQVGMSRATLVRHFRETVGMPPIEYLTQWRLLKAHNMLKYSTDSLNDISEQVGFASRESLTKAFKRQYGYTPMSLRKKISDINL